MPTIAVFTPVTSRVKTLPPSNAFQVAAVYLGDATQVDRVMAANPGLNGDPWWTTLTPIVIPPPSPNSGNGGIIGG